MPNPFSDEELKRICQDLPLISYDETSVKRLLDTIDVRDKCIEELKSTVDFWDKVNERHYFKYIKLGEIWAKAVGKEGTIPDTGRLLDWLAAHIAGLEKALADSPDHSDVDAEKFDTNRLAIENGKLRGRIEQLEKHILESEGCEKCGGMNFSFDRSVIAYQDENGEQHEEWGGYYCDNCGEKDESAESSVALLKRIEQLETALEPQKHPTLQRYVCRVCGCHLTEGQAKEIARAAREGGKVDGETDQARS